MVARRVRYAGGVYAVGDGEGLGPVPLLRADDRRPLQPMRDRTNLEADARLATIGVVHEVKATR